MTPATYAVLLALMNGDLHGYGIIREVESLTASGIRLTPGTLYRSLERMRASELIEELSGTDPVEAPFPRLSGAVERDSPATSGGLRNGRLRVYRVTESGREAVRSEALRLERLVHAAHYVGILCGASADEPSGPIPQIAVPSTVRAVEFYAAVFSAHEVVRRQAAGGAIVHSELRIGGGKLLVHDDVADDAVVSSAPGVTGVRLHVYVHDVDAVFAQALTCGAVGEQAPHDAFWGDRYAVLRDPFGHVWSLAASWRW